ncbi:MAG: dockerin type I repeat-containing protein [Oscillospiraceae bacterium]|nr:dockerin type I repeat-containing protein [Oscillospiraceae bacterium]
MKNKKFLAFLLALACCFQSGACIPAIAEASVQEATEATENLSEIEQVCRQIEDYLGSAKRYYSITSDKENNTIHVTVTETWNCSGWADKVKNYCAKEGLTDKYQFEYYLTTSEGKIIPEVTQEYLDELSSVSEQIHQFILEEEQEDELSSGTGVSNYGYIIIRPATQEQADKIKAFCDEKGFTEKYDIRYDIIYQTDTTIYPEMMQAMEQVQQFIAENHYSATADMFVKYDSEPQPHVVAFFLEFISKTQEELETIKAYCEEHGFTDKYDCRFHLYSDYAEEAAGVKLTAGDVTLDGSIDILDVITVNKAILGKETLTAMQNKTADINHDDKIDSSDALEILKQIVGMAE